MLEYYIVVKDKNSNRVIQSQGSQEWMGDISHLQLGFPLYMMVTTDISIEIPIDEEVTGTYEVSL